MTIALRPVKELFGMNFFIPDYQRGYRWTAQQATDLLEDIWEFANEKKGHSEIYCVQPLVVQRKTEDVREKIREKLEEDNREFESFLKKIINGTWNVVDGQQRLTTIYLILTALEECNPYEIDYETRRGSRDFLLNIQSEDAEDRASANIDFFHIYRVYNTAVDWFKNRTSEQKKKFKDCLLEKVNFIWYQIPAEANDNSRSEAIAAFTRLNIGKIPLTDSELIKALFLNRTNFHCDTVDLETRQRRIAEEWDQIEYALQDDAFWLFLHDQQYDKPTRIDFILDMICLKGENSNPSGRKERDKKDGYDEHKTFRYFYYLFKNHKNNIDESWLEDQWKAVRRYYQIFNEWYHDYKLFHYIGYLTTVGNNSALIPQLVEKWGGCSKQAFTEAVRQRIVEILKRINGFPKLDTTVYEEEKGVGPKSICVPILLLHNIETVIQQNDRLVEDERYALPNFVKFPFHLYKKESWDVEHIRPDAGDQIKDSETKVLYALLAKEYLPDRGGLYEQIDTYIKDPQKDFAPLWEKIREADNSLDEGKKNMIWNYTLLDSKTNREYQNAIFPFKRAFLANKERGFKIKYKVVGNRLSGEKVREIAFVPPCTRNVFAKFYTNIPNGLLEWTQEDAQAYLEDMQDKLAYYLKECGGDR